MIPPCDHTGVFHFHSSTTFGSACLMSARMRARALPRQSPSSAILASIFSATVSPCVGLLIMSPPRLDAELLRVLGMQALPAGELHDLRPGDAADRPPGERAIQHIEAYVPARGAHRDVAAIDAVPELEAGAAVMRLQLPAHVAFAPREFKHARRVGALHARLRD